MVLFLDVIGALRYVGELIFGLEISGFKCVIPT